MNTTLTVISIVSAITIGAMSPGPSFVMVARTSITASRAHGLAAAFGMGSGGIIFAALTLMGLQTLLASVPWLYAALKIGGGAYLAFLGYKIWKGANDPLTLNADIQHAVGPNVGRSFVLGLATQISNPKTAIVYGSIFASLLPPDASIGLLISLPILVFVIEAGWYSIVAVLLSSPTPREAYIHYKSWIDRAAGSVMGLLGVRLILTADES